MLTTLFSLLVSFGKIGIISLGGGNSMLKLIEYEAVMTRHWIDHKEFVHMLGSSFLFPGLTAVKLSALIGYKAAGVLGLCIAVAALNLPGLLLAVFGYGWMTTQDGPFAHKLMSIVQYGALALLLAASFSLAQEIGALQPSTVLTGLCLLFFLALVFFNTSPFWGFLVFIGLGFILVP